MEHKQRVGGQGLVFGTDGGQHPFTPTNVRRKANLAWKKAGLTPISLHPARHTAASFYIAAGVNAKALSTYMGHSSIQITFDLCGHLMPGNEAEAAAQVHAWMAARQQASNAHSNAQAPETAACACSADRHSRCRPSAEAWLSWLPGLGKAVESPVRRALAVQLMPTALDNGQGSPRGLLAAVVRKLATGSHGVEKDRAGRV